MAWKIEFVSKAGREFRKLPKGIQKRLRDYLRDRVLAAENPRALGAALTSEKAQLWRYRVGDYRLVCNIEDDRRTILILRVGHRSSIYD